MLRILIKDLRTNGIFWGAVLVAQVLFAMTLANAADPFRASGDLIWLGLADAFAMTIAVVSLVQTDGPGNPLGDWRIRPVGWSSVLLAKAVTVGAIIVLPRLILGTAMAGLFQQTILEAAMATCLRMIVDLMILGLAVALATATRDAAQAAIAAGLFMATWLLVMIWLDGSPSFITALIARSDLSFGLAVLSVVATVVAIVLYRGWKSVPLRWGLAVAGLAWAPVTIGTLFAIEMTRPPPERGETSATRQVSLQIADFGPAAPAEGEMYGLYISYAQNRPDDVRLRTTMIRIFRISGSTETLMTEYPPFGEDSRPDTVRVLDVGNGIGRIAPTDSMRIEFDYTVYRRKLLRSLPTPDGALHRVEGIGSCVQRLVRHEQDFSSTSVACLSAVRPECLSLFQVRCAHERVEDWFRWPSPYASVTFGTDQPRFGGLSTWTVEGRITREITLTRKELDALAKPLSADQLEKFHELA